MDENAENAIDGLNFGELQKSQNDLATVIWEYYVSLTTICGFTDEQAMTLTLAYQNVLLVTMFAKG